MYISKELQKRLDYEKSLWEDINKEKEIFNSKQQFFHFKLLVMNKLKNGKILCDCGEKATVFGLSLFMCQKCDNEISESMISGHEIPEEFCCEQKMEFVEYDGEPGCSNIGYYLCTVCGQSKDADF